MLPYVEMYRGVVVLYDGSLYNEFFKNGRLVETGLGISEEERTERLSTQW